MTAPRPAAHGGGLLRLAALALIWGSNFAWIKVALGSFSPALICVLRSALGAAALAVIILVGRRRLPARSLWGHLAVVALAGIALPYTLIGVAEQLISSGLASAINATTPLFTLLFSMLLIRHRAGGAGQVAGLLLGLAGTVIMLRPWESGGTLAGGLLSLGTSACYGLTYTYIARFVTSRGDAVGSSIGLAAMQVGLAAPMAALALPLFGPPVHGLGWPAAAALLGLGVIGTGLAYVLNYRMIEADGAVLASTVTYLIPIVAIGFGIVVLHERLDALMVLGMAVTLVGVALTRRR